jgi:hypothetical protein
MTKRFLTPIRLPSLNSDPENPEAGEMYFNSSSNIIRQYNGTSWKDIPDSVSGGSGQTDWSLYWQPSW